jgi:hypothetical protein
MTDPGHGPSPESSGSNQAVAADPKPKENVVNIPPMSAETWELVEFRLWSKFRIKLWTLLAGFLTVTTLLGILGLPAYIRTQFQDKIDSESKKIDLLRENMAKEWAEFYAHQKVEAWFLQKYIEDRDTLVTVARAAKDEIDNSPYYKIHQDELETLLQGFKEITSLTFSIDEFKSLINRLSRAQDATSHDSPPPSGGITPNFPKTNELFDLYAHVSALGETLRWSLVELVKKEKMDEAAKQQLTREYELVFFPKYREYFEQYGLHTLLIATSTWSMPFPNATTAFRGIDSSQDFFEQKPKPQK